MFKTIMEKYTEQKKNMYYTHFMDLLSTGVFTTDDIMDNIELFNEYNNELGFIIKGECRYDYIRHLGNVLIIKTDNGTRVPISIPKNELSKYDFLNLVRLEHRFYFNGIVKINLSGTYLDTILKNILEIRVSGSYVPVLDDNGNEHFEFRHHPTIGW